MFFTGILATSLAFLALGFAIPLFSLGIENTVPATTHVTRLRRGHGLVKHRLQNPRNTVDGHLAAPIGTARALPIHQPVEYLAEVRAGGHRYALQIDTGSSDTWFVKNGFECLMSHCNMGPVFRGEFPGGPIKEHLNISYGGEIGAFINGEMGYSDLTVANITLPKQQIALATLVSWLGDGISSGILGLGLPGLTSSFRGTNPIEDGFQNLVTYPPVTSTIANHTGKHIFSLGLSRNESASFLAIGGVPQNIKVTNYSRVPMEKMPKPFGGSEYLYYALTPSSITWLQTNNLTQTTTRDTTLPQMIIDSGTTLNVFPRDIAQSINAHFTPPAVWSTTQGGWFVPCDAVPPRLGIRIGGQTFWTDESSMILPQVTEPETGYCATGIGTTDGSLYILGDVFLQELVAVFDVGPNKEMRFAKRLP